MHKRRHLLGKACCIRYNNRMRIALTALLLFPCIAFAQGTGQIKPYPDNVKLAFLRNCVGFHKEMLKPCQCMIDSFEKRLPLEDFTDLANTDDPVSDKRFTTIANFCLSTPKQ